MSLNLPKRKKTLILDDTKKGELENMTKMRDVIDLVKTLSRKEIKKVLKEYIYSGGSQRGLKHRRSGLREGL